MHLLSICVQSTAPDTLGVIPCIPVFLSSRTDQPVLIWAGGRLGILLLDRLFVPFWLFLFSANVHGWCLRSLQTVICIIKWVFRVNIWSTGTADLEKTVFSTLIQHFTWTSAVWRNVCFLIYMFYLNYDDYIYLCWGLLDSLSLIVLFCAGVLKYRRFICQQYQINTFFQNCGI